MNLEINHNGNGKPNSDRLLLLFFRQLLTGEYGIVKCTAPYSEQYLVIRRVDGLFHQCLVGGLLPGVKEWEAAGLRAHHAAFLPVVMPQQGQKAVPPEEQLPLKEALRKQRDIVHRYYLAGQNACLTAQGAADSVYGWRDYQFPSLAVQSYVRAWNYHSGETVAVIENRCLALLFSLADSLHVSSSK